MHRTPILHGIKGIFPIIKKECPQAIHYPSRYSGLKGYRLAIDATLLVQRFHFSDDELPYRHVIGFYRLIRSLRASDVYPIFVFDHLSSRLKAKARETEKRREAKGIMRERMRVEHRRAWRLKQLNQLVNRILALSQEERLQVGRLLRAWAKSDAAQGSHADGEDRVKEIETFFASVGGGSTDSADVIRDWSAFRLLAEDGAKAEDVQAPALSEDNEQGLGIPPEDAVEVPEEELSISVQDLESPWQTIHEEQTSPVYSIAVQIDTLWRDFKEHHGQAEIKQQQVQEQQVAVGTSQSGDVETTQQGPPIAETTPSLTQDVPPVDPQQAEGVSSAQPTSPMAVSPSDTASPASTPTATSSSSAAAPPPAAEATTAQDPTTQHPPAQGPPTQAPTPPAPAPAVPTPAPAPAPAPASASPPPPPPPPPPTPPPPTAAQREMNLIEEQLYTSLMSGLTAETAPLPKADDATWKAVQEKMDSSIEHAAKEVDRVSDQPEEPVTPTAVARTAETATAETPIEPPPPPPSPTMMEVDQTAFEAITARNESLARSYKKSTAPLAPSVFDDCAQLCALMQAPVLWTGSGSPHGGERGEAEALAASLVAAGYADAVATEDSDVLLAEVPLLRHLTGTKKPLELVDSQAVRRTLFPPTAAAAATAGGPSSAAKTIEPAPASEATTATADASDVALQDAASRSDALSRYSMVELALLCGTDFNRTIPGLGGKGALRLLQKYGTLRAILKSHPPASKKYHPPDGLSWKEYGGELTRARTVFKTPPDAHRAMRLNGLRSWDGAGEQRRRRRSRSSSKGRSAAKDKDGDPVVEELQPDSTAETVVDVASDASSTTQSSIEDYNDAEQAEEALVTPDEPLSAEMSTQASAEEPERSSDPVDPPSLIAMADDIPSEDNSTTLKADEAEALEAESRMMRMPPPPSKSLLLALAEEPARLHKDDEQYREFSPSHRQFVVPDYDRLAVRAFLRSKGVDKGRELASRVESSMSWREREDALQSGLATADEDDHDRSGGDETNGSAPSLGENAFGETTFGDGGGTMRFEWDGAGEMAEEVRDDEREGEKRR